MGEGVSNDPTTKNLDGKRAKAQGLWMKEFVYEICLPIARMVEEHVLVEPSTKFIAQNNGSGEKPNKLY
jgi:hypothetical protein